MQQALQFKNKTTSNEVTGFLFKPCMVSSSTAKLDVCELFLAK
jgi:hypothetical protein